MLQEIRWDFSRSLDDLKLLMEAGLMSDIGLGSRFLKVQQKCSKVKLYVPHMLVSLW